MGNYEYFTEIELMCRCGCGKASMHPEFMARLLKLREEYGKPMYLSSAYRCPIHNSRVSKTGMTGPHTTGRAVDVLVFAQDTHKLVTIALNLGFTGVGVSQRGSYQQRFIHLDDLVSDKRPNIWSY
jgi:uncharacterized protein YcbK (DUF882 family)